MNPKFLMVFILVFPTLGAFLGFALGRKKESYRDIFNVIMTGIVFATVTYLYKYVSVETIEFSVPNIMGTGLYLKLDVFRYIFLWVTTFVWFLVTLYSTRYLVKYKNRNRYYLFFMLTLASTIGIFISENLLNLFTFFEIMSLTSYVLVIHDEDDYSHEAGNTYLVMAVSGGLVLLMGLFLLYDYTKTLDINELHAAVKNLGNVKYFISALIIIGFGVKAGMVPFHIWMPKAHPAAPAPASAILSGILVKTGIFGIMIVVNIMMAEDMPLSIVILIIGFLNMFIGGFLAMFQRNIKRILAYSSMSQIGYILVGIGLAGILREHGSIAIYGSLYYVLSHAIFKSLLFMVAGVIYVVLHELSINLIGGFGRNKKILKVLFLIGMFSIMGIPGFNGYTGKTLLHVALSEAHHMYGGFFLTLAEFVFTLSSAFTAAYLLKIFIAIFVEKNDPFIEKMRMQFRGMMYIPMAILGAACIYIGIRPDKIFTLIEKAIDTFPGYHKIAQPHFYSASHISSSFVIAGIGICVYVLFIRACLRKKDGEHWWYKNYALNWFNLERDIFKPVGKATFNVCSVILKVVDNSLTGVGEIFTEGCRKFSLLEVEYIRSIGEKIKNAVDIEFTLNKFNMNKNAEGANEDIKVTTNIKQEAQQLGEKINSVTYSIFLFAIVLVVCLFIIIQ